ncbi:MAG: xylulokinase [Ruminococcaceae bacterium]|nr:xylulokinase [Oscillospiraceae bacterium]
MLYIGIDLGTSATKFLLVDEAGKILNSISKEYPVIYPKSGWSEQDPNEWWNAVKTGIPELLNGFNGQEVNGIGVAGQMHGLVVLDENDNIIRNVILWNDGRTAKETEYLNTVIGKDKLSANTANIAFAGFTAPKLLWMKENEPDNFKKISKIMLPKDYINYKLTGVHACDYSDASGMLLLDVENKCWSEEMLDICSIAEEQMPKLFESFEVIGNVKKEVANELGISEAIVVAGAGDNAAAAIGTGTSGNGKCNISLGTSGTVFISSDKFGVDKNNALHSFCHADGGYHLMGCILSAASCHKWICDKIFTETDYNKLEQEIDNSLLGKNELFFLPYLMGERSPINDTDATGVFIGLRPDTTRSQMLLAVLEGVSFAIRDNIEVAKSIGIDVKSSYICGGGAKSKLWRKILSNILNIELMIPNAEEGPGYGSVMLSMVGAGEFNSVEECAKKLLSVKDNVSPEKELVNLYEERYNKFRQIYPAIKELYKNIKE